MNIPPKIYGTPKGSVHWDIEHPKFKWLPELQDYIFDQMNSIPTEIKDKLLEKYHKTNLSLLVMLSTDAVLLLEKDINNYLTTGTI
ncbi:MAG: hypothetical protein JWP44_4179 [Mucilaginibacter sp.]|nr:hypothetical protein [Mucilaginibacter sp.]